MATFVATTLCDVNQRAQRRDALVCVRIERMRAFSFYVRAIIAGVWFAIACSIAIALLPFRWRDPSMGAVFARILHHVGAKIWGFRSIVENPERLYARQPCIYVSNHQSNLDVFTYSIMYPFKTVVIAKKELKWMPFFGIFLIGAGNIMINRSDRKNSLAGLEVASRQIVENGLSVWVFPEGTRNRGSANMLPFKKGAFYMAIKAQVPVVPIVHQHLLTYFDYSEKHFKGGDIKIKVLEPIETKGKTLDDLPALMAEVRTKMEAVLT